jgi:hypothetical protein
LLRGFEAAGASRRMRVQNTAMKGGHFAKYFVRFFSITSIRASFEKRKREVTMRSKLKKHLVSISVCHLICISTQKAASQLSPAQPKLIIKGNMIQPLISSAPLSDIRSSHTQTHTKEDSKKKEKSHAIIIRFPARPLKELL